MAHITYLHRHLNRDADDDSHHHHYRRNGNPRAHTVDRFFPLFSSSSSSNNHFPHAALHDPYPLSEHNDFNIQTFDENAVSDPESVILGGPDVLDHENQVNFVMDLFQQQVEQSQVMNQSSHLVSDSLNESDFGVIEENCNLSLDNLELDLGLGFGEFQNMHHHDNRSHNNNNNNNNNNVVIYDDDDDFFVKRRLFGIQSCEAGSSVSVCTSAIRVNGYGCDSDSEDNENTLTIDLHSGDEYGLDHVNMGNDVYDNFDDDDEEEDEDASVSIPLCWDSLQLEDHREHEDFEWEEVDGRVDEREVLSMFVDDYEASLSLSISPIIAPEDMVNVEREGGLGSLEWQVLLNANNLDSNPDRVQDHHAEPYVGGNDDYIYTTEYEMLFGQFTENESALMGRPPAAKSAVEKLLSVVLTKEDVASNSALCAVCKDEINVGERVKQLPCTHRYHGECIVPWLGIRNTCPVCRYELPTDDQDYERRKAAQRAIVAGRF